MNEKGLYLKENENIKRYELQHWIVPLRAITFFIFFLALASFMFYGAVKSLETFEIAAKITMIFVYLTTLVAIHWFASFIFRYLNSRTYITNIRVINFNAVPMLADDITYILIDEIHEIEEHKKGLIRNILNYGNIIVNLPAMPNAIELTDMKRPEHIVDYIENIRREHTRKRQNNGNEEERIIVAG